MTTNYIQLKRTSVPGKVPLPEDLAVGEIAINFADQLIYTKNGYDEIISIGGANIDSEIANRIAGDSDLNKRLDSELAILRRADSDNSIAAVKLVNLADVSANGVADLNRIVVTNNSQFRDGIYTKYPTNFTLEQSNDQWLAKTRNGAFYFYSPERSLSFVDSINAGINYWKLFNGNWGSVNQDNLNVTSGIVHSVSGISDVNDVTPPNNDPVGTLVGNIGGGITQYYTANQVINNDILKYESATNMWVPTAIPKGTVDSDYVLDHDSDLKKRLDSDIGNVKLNNLSDVDTTDIAHNRVPAWDSDSQTYKLITIDAALNSVSSFDGGSY
jgi:hypothetical protein